VKFACAQLTVFKAIRTFEDAVERFGRRVHVGNLVRMETEDVAQDENGELARWQKLKGGHKGQGDGFGLLIAGLRAERHADSTREESVGKWL